MADEFKQKLDHQGHVEHVQHGDACMMTSSQALEHGARIKMVGRPQQHEEGNRPLCVRLADAIDLPPESAQLEAHFRAV